MRILVFVPLLLFPVLLWPRPATDATRRAQGLEEVGPTVLMNARDRGAVQILDLRSGGRAVPGAAARYVAGEKSLFLLGDASRCRQVAREWKIESGYIVAPRFIEFEPMAGVPQIAPRTAKRKDWPIFDVSEASEWELRRIRGSRRLDYARFGRRDWHELPRDRPFIVACRVGHRSQLVTQTLRQNGFRAVNLTGGLWEWESQNLPLEGAAVKP
jgi:rhodanese-related sulfurtransferase